MSGRSSMDMPSLTPASTLTSKQPSLQCYDIDIDCLPSGIESFYNSNYLHSTKKRAPPPVPSTYLTTIKTHRAPKIPAPQPLNYVYSSNSSTHFNVHPLNEFRKIRAPTNNCEKPVNCKQSVNCEGLQYIDDETYCNSADNVLVDNDVESPGHQRLQFLPSTLGSRNHSSNLSIDGWSEARPASNLHSTYISCTVAKDKVPKNFLSRALSLEPGKKSKKDTYSIDANNNNNSNSKQQVLEGKERRKTIALSANPLGSIFKKMEKKVERSFSQRLGAENGIFGATKESAAANEVIKRGYETDCGVVGSQVAQTNNTNKSPSPITIRRKLSSQSKVRSRRQSKFVDQRELDERDWQSEECMDGKIEFDLPQELDMRSSLVVRQQTALRVKAIVDLKFKNCATLRCLFDKLLN